MNALLPVIFLFTGLVPIEVSSMLLALIFIPYIFVTLHTLQRSSNFSFTFQSLAFSMGSFGIHLHALLSILTGQKETFTITEKRGSADNNLSLVTPHLLYIAVVLVGIWVALMREGISASFVNNVAWALFNISIFIPCIVAALPQKNVARKRRGLAEKIEDEEGKRIAPARAHI